MRANLQVTAPHAHLSSRARAASSAPHETDGLHSECGHSCVFSLILCASAFLLSAICSRQFFCKMEMEVNRHK